MPGKLRATSAALATSASMSRPVTGRTWIVTSRATSACQSLAALRTSMTAPVVSDARKVMIATTATRAWPAMVLFGTIGVSKRGRSSCGAAVGSSSGTSARVGSVIDMHTPFVQHEPARVVLVHQRDVVGGDHDRGARLVELDEQPQQPLRKIGIDVAGRLVGEQQLRPRDHRARDRGALLLAAREHRRERPHALAEPDPIQ